MLKICYGLKVNRKDFKKPKGACIVLANHVSMYDFLMVMLSFYPKRLNAITAHKWFLNKPLNKLLPIMGCIPKFMFDPDVKSVIAFKTVLKRGGGVLLFPEGRCSSSQTYVGIHTATGKLIKKLGVPVVSCYIEGAEICMAHWRKKTRFGRVQLTYKNLFTEDDLKNMSVDEINTTIDNRLSGNDNTTTRKKPLSTLWSRDLSEGLHHLLYYCPKCEQEYSMQTMDNTITCSVCGNSATYDRFGTLTPIGDSVFDDSIPINFRNQVKHEMRLLHKDMTPIEVKVTMRNPSPVSGGGMIDVGVGTMSLDTKGWTFEGTLSEEATTLLFPVDTIPAISYDHNDNFQIYHNGMYYMFIPEDPIKCLKYVILTECAHRRFASKVLMTLGKDSGFAE
jgi:hypothetical protein